MAVYTKINKKDLNLFTKKYDIGKVLKFKGDYYFSSAKSLGV